MGRTKYPQRGNGEGIRWLRAHANHTGDECLLWPWYVNPKGYGIVGFEGKPLRAHRFMCELANGAPPVKTMEAAHSCGNRACVNPMHLNWKTSRDNHLDQRQHGTQATSRFGRKGALKPEQVIAIRLVAGLTAQSKIADHFGVSEETVRKIQAGLVYANI